MNKSLYEKKRRIFFYLSDAIDVEVLTKLEEEKKYIYTRVISGEGS